MKIKVNENMILVGTPEEMVEFVRLTKLPEDGGPFEPKVVTPETPERPAHGRGKLVDWPKAEALKAAGWTQKAIADELGIHEATVSKHFRELRETAS